MSKKSGWWKGLLKYALGFGLLAFVVWRNWDDKVPDPAQFPDKPPQPGLKTLLFSPSSHLEVAPLAIAAVLVLGVTAVQFYRWYLLVRALDLPFTLRNAVRLGLVGYFYNTFLPGSVGGDLVKAYFIARGHPGRRAAAVATVVADRLIGLFGLIMYVAAVGGACWAYGGTQIDSNDYLKGIIRVCVGLAAAAAAGYVGLGLLPAARAHRFGGRLHRLPKVGATLAELWFAGWQYRQRPRAVLTAVGLSAVAHTGFVLIFHFAVRVFSAGDPGGVASLPEHFVVAPIGYIGQALFPAPGGVGGGEAIFGYLYTILGRPETVGVAGRLAMRLIEWTFGLVGYIAYLRMRTELPGQAADGPQGSAEPAPVGGVPA